MKTLIVLSLLLLTACYSGVDPESFRKAELKCVNSGGLQTVYNNVYGRVIAYCNDGTELQFKKEAIND